MKAYVLLIWALDTALQVITVHSTYELFVTNFSNLLNLFEYNVYAPFDFFLRRNR